MPRPELDRLREIYAAWGRGDYSRADFLHPAFELVFAPGFLDEGRFSGVADTWRGWRGWLEQWETWHYEPVRYVELDDGRIVVFIDMTGVSKASGMELSSEAANLWEFEDGAPRRLVLYLHREDLLRELGLQSA